MSAAVANEEGMEATTPTSEGREESGRGDGRTESKMEHCNGRKFLQ